MTDTITVITEQIPGPPGPTGATGPTVSYLARFVLKPTEPLQTEPLPALAHSEPLSPRWPPMRSSPDIQALSNWA